MSNLQSIIAKKNKAKKFERKKVKQILFEFCSCFVLFSKMCYIIWSISCDKFNSFFFYLLLSKNKTKKKMIESSNKRQVNEKKKTKKFHPLNLPSRSSTSIEILVKGDNFIGFFLLFFPFKLSAQINFSE